MTDTPKAFTLWCKGGRIGTYRTCEAAEAVMRDIANFPLKFLHIQEWEPEPHHLPFVTFEDKEQDTP